MDKACLTEPEMYSSVKSSVIQPSTLSADFKFPAMPQTLAEIMRLRAQGTPDVEQLVEIVKKDPGIAAGVLRRVNSAYFGLSRKVVQVDKAVGLLGYREVFGLTLAAAVKQAFMFRGTEEASTIYRHVMRHSIATAALAKILAEDLSPIATETAFTAGLLHQIGRQVFLASIPKPYTDLWLRLSPTREIDNLVTPTPAMERFVFRTDYTQVGVVLAQRWGMPDEMITVIRSHHDHGSITAPFLRSLALMVAVGHAVASELFEPVSRTETIAELLGELHALRNASLGRISALVEDRRDDVRRFTESLMVE